MLIIRFAATSLCRHAAHAYMLITPVAIIKSACDVSYAFCLRSRHAWYAVERATLDVDVLRYMLHARCLSLLLRRCRYAWFALFTYAWCHTLRLFAIITPCSPRAVILCARLMLFSWRHVHMFIFAMLMPYYAFPCCLSFILCLCFARWCLICLAEPAVTIDGAVRVIYFYMFFSARPSDFIWCHAAYLRRYDAGSASATSLMLLYFVLALLSYHTLFYCHVLFFFCLVHIFRCLLLPYDVVFPAICLLSCWCYFDNAACCCCSAIFDFDMIRRYSFVLPYWFPLLIYMLWVSDIMSPPLWCLIMPYMLTLLFFLPRFIIFAARGDIYAPLCFAGDTAMMLRVCSLLFSVMRRCRCLCATRVWYYVICCRHVAHALMRRARYAPLLFRFIAMLMLRHEAMPIYVCWGIYVRYDACLFTPDFIICFRAILYDAPRDMRLLLFIF